MKKCILNESDSHSYLPLDLNKVNSFMNKSNNKGNIHNTYLNNFAHVDNKNNINNIENIFIYEYKKITNKKYTNHLYKDSLRQNNELKNMFEKKYDGSKINNPKIKNIINNYLFKEKNNNLNSKGNYDVISNLDREKDELTSYREGSTIKGKRRFLSTRVHICGANSSKNFNNVFI